MVSRPEITVPVDSVAARSLEDPSLYVSRELSWLEFNDRVLEEALDESNPQLGAQAAGRGGDPFPFRRREAARRAFERDLQAPAYLAEAANGLLARGFVPGARTLRDPHFSLRVAGRSDPRLLAADVQRAGLPDLDAACDRSRSSLPVHLESLALARRRARRREPRRSDHALRPGEGPKRDPALRPDRFGAGGTALVCLPGGSDRAQFGRALPRDDHSRIVLVSRHARRGPHLAGRRGGRSAAGDRIGAAQAPLRRAGPPRGGRRDAATRARQAPGSALTLGLGLLRVRGDARDVRSVGARQPRYPGAARSAVHTVDPAQARRCDRYLRGHPRGRHPAAAPL